MYRFCNSIVISDLRSNLVFPGYRAQFEWNVYEGYVAASSMKFAHECSVKLPADAVLSSKIYILEVILEIGATAASSSPPFFCHSAGLTDWNMETTLTNRSFFSYYRSLAWWIISGSLTSDDFVTCKKSSRQHTPCVSRAPVLILRLILLKAILPKRAAAYTKHQWFQKHHH